MPAPLQSELEQTALELQNGVNCTKEPDQKEDHGGNRQDKGKGHGKGHDEETTTVGTTVSTTEGEG